MSQAKTTMFLCKTEACANWFSCGGMYGKAGDVLVEEDPKHKTFLCKDFKKKESGVQQ